MNISTVSISYPEVQAALAAVAKQRARDQAAAQPKRLWLAIAGAALAIGAAAAIAWSNLSPARASGQAPEAPAARTRIVSIANPERQDRQEELLLPAEVHAYQTTSIHARIAGYLKAWHADRGTRVKAGQVLAEIDAPEFDQELRRSRSELDEGAAQLEQARTERDQAQANLLAARANVLKAKASLELAAKTEERFKDLEEKWAATRQQYDEAVRNHEAAKAELAAAEANVGSFAAALATREAAIRTSEAHLSSLRSNVKRLEETEAFKKLVAPFDGVITSRGLDVGALVSPDGSRELFMLAQDDVLRITANVPQTYAALVHEGQTADVVAKEFAREGFQAKVARTAGAIDSGARTLPVELELPNPERKLLPGAFTQVRFLLRDDARALRIPAGTLRFAKEGPQVVIVDARGRLQPQAIKLGRDFGAKVEVLTGLTGQERLVVNPTDNMLPGEAVQVAQETSRAVASK